jgi:hypothetical protein
MRVYLVHTFKVVRIFGRENLSHTTVGAPPEQHTRKERFCTHSYYFLKQNIHAWANTKGNENQHQNFNQPQRHLLYSPF